MFAYSCASYKETSSAQGKLSLSEDRCHPRALQFWTRHGHAYLLLSSRSRKDELRSPLENLSYLRELALSKISAHTSGHPGRAFSLTRWLAAGKSQTDSQS